MKNTLVEYKERVYHVIYHVMDEIIIQDAITKKIIKVKDHEVKKIYRGK